MKTHPIFNKPPDRNGRIAMTQVHLDYNGHIMMINLVEIMIKSIEYAMLIRSSYDERLIDFKIIIWLG